MHPLTLTELTEPPISSTAPGILVVRVRARPFPCGWRFRVNGACVLAGVLLRIVSIGGRGVMLSLLCRDGGFPCVCGLVLVGLGVLSQYSGGARRVTLPLLYA